MSEAGSSSANAAGVDTTNGKPTRTARIEGELPPPVRGIPKLDRDGEDDDEDEDAASDSGESEFDEATVKSEGGLAARIQELDEREHEDKKKLAERAANGEEPVQDDAAEQAADLLADYPDDTEDVELTHARLRSLKTLDLQRFAGTLKRLSFRQNLLTSLLLDDGTSPLGTLTELEEIDLYDNRIGSVKGLKALTKLTSLDLSFNLLRKVPADQIADMKSLRVLYFIQNKIAKIQGLEAVAGTLESVEFGGNKLRTIENLEACTKLTELWLGKNKIAKLEGMSTLRNLKILSIQSNRLTKLEGLEDLESLEEIYVSHNGIKKLEGLEKNTKLRVLDIGNNFIKDVEGISHLTELEEFWANNNLIDDLDKVQGQLKDKENLETVYLEGNPLQANLGVHYRRKMMLALPQVRQIDATYVQQV